VRGVTVYRRPRCRRLSTSGGGGWLVTRASCKKKERDCVGRLLRHLADSVLALSNETDTAGQLTNAPAAGPSTPVRYGA